MAFKKVSKGLGSLFLALTSNPMHRRSIEVPDSSRSHKTPSSERGSASRGIVRAEVAAIKARMTIVNFIVFRVG